MSSSTSQTGAENIVWNLSDLYSSDTDPVFLRDLDSIESVADAFRMRWHGRLATIDDTMFATMVVEYGVILEQLDRLGSFAYLQWSTDTDNPSYGRTLQNVREKSAAAWRHIVFVSVSIAQLPEARLLELLASAPLAPYKHWLQQAVVHRPHVLSEEVEQVLSEKHLTSRMAWVRLHDEVSAQQTFHLNGQEYTEASLISLLHEPHRDTRRAAAEALTAGLKEQIRTQAFIFNTVLADKMIDDRLRKYPTWLSARNNENEVSDASVQSLIDSVTSRYDIVRRLYALKKTVLGLDTFYDYDRYAPLSTEKENISWSDARSLVTSTYADFHQEAGTIVKKFFENNWIHAPVRKGKSGGAYSAGTIPSAHPYVFMNYTGSARDVQTLAHELGHGLHQYLSRRQGILQMDTPLTIAETASVFGETITFRRLLANATPERSLALLVAKLDDTVSTVFRQIALNRFEHAVHSARRSEGELSVDRIGEIWMLTQRDQLGDAVVFSPGYEYWWSYISHFLHTPGYVYAYAFGELLVLALAEKYLADPDGFPEKYMDLLRAGGSKRPSELLAPFDINIDDPAFWNIGLNVIERMLVEAETLARTSS
ncbi:MAG TPA: oligoendopeptidase F [Bacteroidetes bacterium]|nr:oligoendopeptidase F [Bacteroidota bacterium]HRK04669.1 M3 family oligoendopeptidase [Chlorobiota bacterium]